MRPQINLYGLPIRDQRPRGTCTIFATTFLLEFMEAKETNKKYLDYSEEYLNAVTNRATEEMTDGSNFTEAMVGYGEYGIVPESSASYKPVFDEKYLQGSDKTTMDLLGIGKNSRRFEEDILYGPDIDNLKTPGLSDEQMQTLLSRLDSGFPVAVGHSGDEETTKTTQVGVKITR